MKHATLMVAFVVAMSNAAHAQTGTIAGTVTDRDTGQPIEGVMVVFVGTSYGIQTKPNGTYVILGIPPGQYRVTAARVGYARTEITGVTIAVDVQRTLDIFLRASTARPGAAADEPGRMTTTTIPNETIAATSVPRPGTTGPLPAQASATTLGADLFSRCLIPPELIMAHQREIDLQDAQRARLITEMSQAQSRFTALQWTISADEEKLEQLLKAPAVDEAAALNQMNRILRMENDVKLAQLSLLLRVKNTLTPRQQELLNSIRGGTVWRPRGSVGPSVAACGA